MGGLGSGRKPTGKVPTVENSVRLQINEILKALPHGDAGMCIMTWPGSGEPLHAIVTMNPGHVHVLTGAGAFQAQWIWRECRFGGRSGRLVCEGCAREVYSLFIYGKTLCCQACLRLPYESQLLHKAQRARQKLIKQIQALTPDGAANPDAIRRPKYMRRHRYLKLLHQIAAASQTCVRRQPTKSS